MCWESGHSLPYLLCCAVLCCIVARFFYAAWKVSPVSLGAAPPVAGPGDEMRARVITYDLSQADRPTKAEATGAEKYQALSCWVESVSN